MTSNATASPTRLASTGDKSSKTWAPASTAARASSAAACTVPPMPSSSGSSTAMNRTAEAAKSSAVCWFQNSLSRRCHNSVRPQRTLMDFRGCGSAGQRLQHSSADPLARLESASQAEYAGSIPVIGSNVMSQVIGISRKLVKAHVARAASDHRRIVTLRARALPHRVTTGAAAPNVGPQCNQGRGPHAHARLPPPGEAGPQDATAAANH